MVPPPMAGATLPEDILGSLLPFPLVFVYIFGQRHVEGRCRLDFARHMAVG